MSVSVHTLQQYGYPLLFAFVLAEQVGLPIPAVPILLTVGALAGAGSMSLAAPFGVALVASLGPDITWYELGRRQGGGPVLGLLCRISLEPDSCVRRSEALFAKHGHFVLLFAKFFPGLSAITAPLAGIVGVSRWQFILLDSGAALLWSGTWMMLGYFFSDVLAIIARQFERLGDCTFGLFIAAFLAFVVYKLVQRQHFLRMLRMARITVDELKNRLDAGDPDLIVVDARSALDVRATPYRIPGASWIAADNVDQRRHDIPNDREIVLYCSCPDEVTSARAALALKRNGVTRVRLLQGGLTLWTARKFPIEELEGFIARAAST